MAAFRQIKASNAKWRQLLFDFPSQRWIIESAILPKVTSVRKNLFDTADSDGAGAPITAASIIQDKARSLPKVMMSFVDQSPYLAWIKDKEFKYRYVNPPFVELFGTANILGQDDYSFIPEATADLLRENDSHVRDTGQSLRTIEDVAGADSIVKRWLVHKFPVPGFEDEQWVGGIAVDVTEWLDAEEELRKSEEKHRRLLEASPFCIHQLDREGRFISMNKAGLDMVNLKTVHEIQGLPYLDCVSEEQRERVEYLMQRAFDGEACDFEFTSSRGQYFRSNFTPLHDEQQGVTSLLGIAEDVTKQKQAERQLRASEERHRLVVAATRDPIWEIDITTGAVWWNDAYDRLFGIHPEETTESWDWWTSRIRESERQSVSESLRNTLADSKAEHWAADYHFRGRSGDELFIQDRAIISRDRNGKALRIVGTMRDQTRTVREMQERQRLLAEVQEAQRLESLGVLAGGIAHDFNNLLTVMLCNISLLQMKADQDSEESEILGEIEGAVDNASDICQQILSYAGKGHFVVKPTCVNQLVREISKLLQVSVKNAELELDLGSDLHPVMCDEAQITQLVMNLAINAAESVGEESGKVLIRLSKVPADSKDLAACQIKSASMQDSFTCIEVSDSGGGMNEATLARIFDPFFTTKSTGRGLGLAAVRGIVRRHNGGLLASGKIGEGSKFQIFLPTTDSPVVDSPRRKEQPPESSDSASNNWVLVVDDEEQVRLTAKRVLDSHGFRTQLAADGEQALSLMKLNPRSYSLVLLNLTMPGMDGRETLQKIKAVNANTPVVMTSGYSEQECLAKLEGLNFDGYVRKPFSPEELIHHVNAATGST